MADINQKIGLDAGGAIQTLAQFDTALKKANKAIEAMARLGDKDLINFNPATASLAQYTAAAQKASAATKQMTASAKASSSELTVSYGTLAKVVQTQVVVRGITALTGGFQKASEEAAEFQLQIAEIFNITSGESLASLDAQVKDLAITLGKDLGETSQAVFQAMQNDLGTTEETFALLKGAIGQLAGVTREDLGAAVNAASSAIKGFGLNVDQAGEIADKFFAAIDFGRITLKDLESSLGTIANLGRQLGVSLDETLGSIAAITRTGTNAATATTQLRNIFNKTIKPTKILTQVFKDLGVSGFQELVTRSGGFIQALQEVSGALDNDSQKIAAAFGTIRANVGVFNLLAEGGTDVMQAIDEVTNSAGRAAAAIKVINDTDAKKLQVSLVESQVILSELGDVGVTVKVQLLQLFKEVVPNALAAKFAIFGAGAAITLLALSTAGVTSALVLLTPILGFVTAALATLWAIDTLEAYLLKVGALRDDLGTIAKAQYKIDLIDDAQVVLVDALADSLLDLGSALNKLVSNSQKAFDKLAKQFTDHTQRISDTATGDIERFIEGRGRLLSEIDKTISDLDDTIANSAENIKDLQKDADDFNFDRSLKGLTDQQRLVKEQSKAYEDLKKAKQAANNVGLSKESQKEAEAVAKTALDSAKAALSTADRGKNASAVAQAERDVNAAIQAQVQVQRNIENVSKSTSVSELTRGSIEAQRVSAAQVNDIKEIKKLLSTTDNEGLVKSPEKIRTDLEKANVDIKKFKSELANFDSLPLLDALNLDGAADKLSQDLASGLSKAEYDFAKAIAEFDRQLNGKTFTANIDFNAAAIASVDQEIRNAAAIAAVKNPNDPVAQTKAIRNSLNDIITTQDGYTRSVAKSAAEVELFSAKAVQAAAAANPEGFSDGIIAGMAEKIPAATEQGLITMKSKLNAAAPEIAALLESLVSSPALQENTRIAFESIALAIQAQLDTIKAESLVDEAQVDEAYRLIETLGEAEIKPEIELTRVEALTLEIEKSLKKAAEAEKAIEAIGPAATSVVAPISSVVSATQKIKAAADQATEAFKAMAIAAAAAAQAAATARASEAASSGGKDLNAKTGGQVTYRADGGPIGRGQDTVSAMLSPGEMVTNAQQSRNFFSELQAINAGSVPQPAGSGGTTINIGDINVNSSSQVPGQTGRDVGLSIQRELRRKTFTL